MKRQLTLIAGFLTILCATAMLKGGLDSWLRTFELSAGALISLETYVLVLAAMPFVVSFFLGGAILGIFAANRHMALLFGLLLSSTFVAIYLVGSGFHSLTHLGAYSLWQVVLSWANLWAPFAASVGGALVANALLVRGRNQDAT